MSAGIIVETWAAVAEMRATLHRTIPIPTGERLEDAFPLPDGRIVLLWRRGEDRVVAEVLFPTGLVVPLTERPRDQLTFVVVDPPSQRLIVSIDNVPELFDLSTLQRAGSLIGHRPVIWELRRVSGGRLVSSSSDRQRILWDLRATQPIVHSDLKIYQSWSVPRGVLPGDPLLVTQSTLEDGRWSSALVNAQSGEAVLNASLPAPWPAHHSVAASPDALEWAGVISEGADDTWGPSRIFHFTAAGPRLIHTETVVDSIPAVVSLHFLTGDWLYCSGARQPPLMINLRTGAQRLSPQQGPVAKNGLMLCYDDVAVMDLDSGALAPLHSAPPVEGRRLEALMITEAGDEALVVTDEALEAWRLHR